MCTHRNEKNAQVGKCGVVTRKFAGFFFEKLQLLTFRKVSLILFDSCCLLTSNGHTGLLEADDQEEVTSAVVY